MQELVYIIDLLKEFYTVDPNLQVNHSILPAAGLGLQAAKSMLPQLLSSLGGAAGGAAGGAGAAAGAAGKAGGGLIGKVGGLLKKTPLGGLAQIGASFIGRGKRRREQGLADAEFAAAKRRYENLDTSNVYAGLQNTMEDLTVNTQAADFAAQQQQQAIANTMGSMSAAAGGSGIAALAQAMAGQQSTNLQQASASIAQQEQANQMAAAQQAMQIQKLKGHGEMHSQEMTMQHEENLLGSATGRKEAADLATADARAQLMGGIGQTVGLG